MKTKLLFATMVLPALFAACTSDEIMDSQSPSLEGRALLSPDFSISVNGEADTRFSWNEQTFGWNGFTAEDKFSAGLVDNLGSVQDKVLTNYIFSTADGENYTTTSQMVEGTYMFYSYPGFESNAKREELAFDLTKQVSTDLNDPVKVINDNQLFIAPLYELEAATANEKMGLTFSSYWSAAAISIKNSSKQSFKIVRILLSDGTDRFAVKGTVSPAKMNEKKLIYSYDKAEGKYVLPKDADDILTADIAVTGATQQDDLVLDCGSYELAAGKSTVAYMQVPAGFYTKGQMEVEVIAEVTENNVTSLKSLKKEVVTNYTEESGTEKIRFRRGKTTAVFGVENGAAVAYNVDDIELISAGDAKGLYASNYDDMYKYLTDSKVLPESGGDYDGYIAIYNIGSLSVDDQLMSLVNRLGDKKVKFINAIDITSESRTGATLKNMAFAGGATITKGNIEFGADVKVLGTNNLTINKGTSATLGSDADDDNFAGEVINYGVLYLNGTTAADIRNDEDAVVEIIGDQTLGTGGAGLGNTPKTLKVAEGVTLDIASNLNIDYGKTLENNGTILGTATLTNSGTIINNAKGTISAVTNTSIEPENGVKRIATIENYGTLTAVTNTEHATNGNGLVVMKSADASIVTVTGGDVDNTIGGFITTNSGAVVFASYEGNQTGKLGNVMACNKVILKNGTWTNPSTATAVATLELENVTLANNAAITLNETNLLKVVMKNSTAAKELTLTAATNVDLTGSTFNGALTLTAATNATLDNATFNGALTAGTLTALNLRGVTFNAGVTAGEVIAVTIQATDRVANTTTTIGGAVGIKAAGTASTITVEENATMDVTIDGSIGSNGNITGTAMTNNGTVNNRGEIKLVSGATGNGTWKGNGATVDAGS